MNRELNTLSIFMGLAVVFSLSGGCKKQSPESEVLTVNGQTFGCRVNGNPFIADKWDYANNIPPVSVEFWFSPTLARSDVQIIGKKDNQYVEVWLEAPVVVGRVNLNTTTMSYPWVVHPQSYGLYQINNPSESYITSSSSVGFVNIVFIDTVIHKIEGNFEFTGKDAASGKTISITNGYFKRI